MLQALTTTSFTIPSDIAGIISDDDLDFVAGRCRQTLTLVDRHEIGAYINEIFGHGAGWRKTEDEALSSALKQRHYGLSGVSAGSIRDMRRIAEKFSREQIVRLAERHSLREIKSLLQLNDRDRRTFVDRAIQSERRVHICYEVNRHLNQVYLEVAVSDDCEKFLNKLAKFDAAVLKFEEQIAKDVKALDGPRQLAMLRKLQELQYRARCSASYLELIDQRLKSATKEACDQLAPQVTV